MSGYVENAMPIATATIFEFRGNVVTGLSLAACVQQYARENDKEFAVARHTDSSGDSYIVGLTSSYQSGQIAVVPSLSDPWLRADKQYKLLQVVTCSWPVMTFDMMLSIGAFTDSVGELAEYLSEQLGRPGAIPRYKQVSFSTAPSFDPRIYLV